jgi:hypothetical protein
MGQQALSDDGQEDPSYTGSGQPAAIYNPQTPGTIVGDMIGLQPTVT